VRKCLELDIRPPSHELKGLPQPKTPPTHSLASVASNIPVPFSYMYIMLQFMTGEKTRIWTAEPGMW